MIEEDFSPRLKPVQSAECSGFLLRVAAYQAFRTLLTDLDVVAMRNSKWELDKQWYDTKTRW